MFRILLNFATSPMKPKAYLFELASLATRAASQAAEAIMALYDGPVEVERKTDGSPVTLADRAANDLIGRMLAETGIPIISEEDAILPFDQRKHWGQCWLVDPLDGTKEFIKRNGEFTVNIALIQDQAPILGVIHAPAMQTAWVGMPGLGLWKATGTGKQADGDDLFNNPGYLEPITVKPSEKKTIPGKRLRLTLSRSHGSETIGDYVRFLEQTHGPIEHIQRGSSLKFCALAEREALVYPRFSPCYEWDTGAGHAIVRASGGEVYAMPGKTPLRYNKPDFLNPSFIALADKRDLHLHLLEFPF